MDLLGGKKSVQFPVIRGTKQGNGPSVLCFIILMDQTYKQFKRETERCRVGNFRVRQVYVQDLVYADDIALNARVRKDVRISECSNYCLLYTSLRKIQIAKM